MPTLPHPLRTVIIAVLQRRSPIDAARENVRLQDGGHEMVIVSDEQQEMEAREADVHAGNDLDFDEDVWDAGGQLGMEDSFSYDG